MSQRWMKLVGKLVSGTAASGAFRASPLDHEVRDYPVEDQPVVEALSGLGSFGKADKILDGLGGLGGEQLYLEVSFRSVE